MTREPDIKAPDGATLGGVRRVRKDGTILFNRGWWRAPPEWIGQDVWVHEDWRGGWNGAERLILEIAEPGLHIHEARRRGRTAICERTDRADARIGLRGRSRAG